jgi:aldehyde dehydrogenase (NAD+)
MSQDILRQLKLTSHPELPGAWGANGAIPCTGGMLVSDNPTTGAALAQVREATTVQYDVIVADARNAFANWRQVPAPLRGSIVREMADEFRRNKAVLGRLVTLEVGKIVAEGEGEIQEIIDIADFAVGLSRQLYGNTMHSERPQHRMYEQWHPLGVVGVISAFNFPAAVWAWNALIALVCGDTVVWKPSRKAPLTAIACHQIAHDVLTRHGHGGVLGLVIGGDADVGERMLADTRLPLISATGSTGMGRRVAQVVGARLGRTLLELGGNNAAIVCADADLDLAVRAILFGAVGTAGQRCTSMRRVIVMREVADELTRRLVAAWQQVRIGDPMASDTMMGPLIDEASAAHVHTAIAKAQAGGAKLLTGGTTVAGMRATFMAPALLASPLGLSLLREEVFGPMTHIVTVDTLQQAIELQNDSAHGLSSSIFTSNMRIAEQFLSVVGSDCGIANVNIGTSGAEIGGAFGGEKDTGGGREAGSDSWKAYMRRQTSTINWGATLPLAQGITFG